MKDLTKSQYILNKIKGGSAMDEKIRKIIGNNKQLLELMHKKLNELRTEETQIQSMLDAKKTCLLEVEKLIAGLTANMLDDDGIEKALMAIMIADKAFQEILQICAAREAMRIILSMEKKEQENILEKFESDIKN